MSVELREITAATLHAVTGLSPAPGQQRFVAPNAMSLAEALFSDEAWYRGVWIGEEPVGFVMVADQTLRADPPPSPTIGLWRLMVDRRAQGRGIGRSIVEQVARSARARGFSRLHTSYVVAEGGPEGFYRALGFVPTGEFDGGEAIAVLDLGEKT